MDYDFSKTKAYLNTNKNFLFVIKSIVFIIAFWYLTQIIYKNLLPIQTLTKDILGQIISFIIVASLIYVLLLLVLAQAWKRILEAIDEKHFHINLLNIYLKSLLYKYIPGNVFHYVNRQFSANKMGVSHKALWQSNIYEAFGLIFSALFLSIYLIIDSISSDYLIIKFLAAIFLICFFVVVYFKHNKSFYIAFSSIIFYLIYFLGIGLICYYAINQLSENNISLINCISLYSIAWIAGYIIPGAPGGLGVRESVFILFSSSLISQPDAIYIIALLRLSTTIGEIFAFVLAKVMDLYYQSDTLNL